MSIEKVEYLLRKFCPVSSNKSEACGGIRTTERYLYDMQTIKTFEMSVVEEHCPL